MTKSEAFDIIAAAIEYRQDDIMNSERAALTRIRGTYWGIMARGIDPDPTPAQQRKSKTRSAPPKPSRNGGKRANENRMA